MATITVSAGKALDRSSTSSDMRDKVFASLERLFQWLEQNDYKGYDTFDGLNSSLARRLTMENDFLRTVLQQGVRRFPINVRPLLGIPKAHSTKGMGFLARGFLRLYDVTGEAYWRGKAEYCLDWLCQHQSPGYSGACWGNHFDYQSRSFYLPKGVPTVVWTSLIGHAFLDGYERLQNSRYLETAVSACRHILKDLERFSDGDTFCIGYIPANTPAPNKVVHNSNTLGASLLARTYFHCQNEEYREVAAKAIAYTAKYQRDDGSWYYGEPSNLHWVDNFHTAYVLDCFKHYAYYTKDDKFNNVMMKGYAYWKSKFFLEDGTPRYYDRKTLPLDIQCCSQAIDTLVLFKDRDPESLVLAKKVSNWTIENMQDSTGYFYYRRYSPWLVNKTPTLHWGQATMFCALAGLYRSL